MHRSALVVGIVVACSGLITAGFVASADQPPRPGTDNSDLDENESATLWSKEPNECLSDEAYEDQYGEERTAMHGLANCTDITFEEPPDTAERWTDSDFESLEPGDAETSQYPENADRNSSVAVEDAHATIFAVQPSTILHQNDTATPEFVAPEGELRGLIDYRLQPPADEDDGNETVEWSVLDHDVTDVQLRQDGEAIAHEDGEQTPTLEYELTGSGETTLEFEADIEVELEQEITEEVGNETETRYEYSTDKVTVSDDRDVEIYDLTAEVSHAEYPDGESGVAIDQSQPWHGATLSEDGNESVDGVWRYYTAHDTEWETVVESTDTGEEEVDPDALPVSVRAYPSELGPQAEPIHDGPEIDDVWGTEQASPNETVHENVELDITEEPYTQSDGVAIYDSNFDRDHLSVEGIVRGEEAEIVEPDGGVDQEISESELSLEIIEESDSEAALEVELRDAETGDPINLSGSSDDDSQSAPSDAEAREGYITVADEEVKTNNSGIATVTVSEPGIYSAEYNPGPWHTHDPAYTGDSASVSWHPLVSVSGWFTLLVDVIWISIPFLVALYAGLRLGSFLRIPEDQQ